MVMQPLPLNPGSSAAGAGDDDDRGGGRGRGRGFGRCSQNGQHRKGQKILGLKELLRLTRELLRGIRQEEVQTSRDIADNRRLAFSQAIQDLLRRQFTSQEFNEMIHDPQNAALLSFLVNLRRHQYRQLSSLENLRPQQNQVSYNKVLGSFFVCFLTQDDFF